MKIYFLDQPNKKISKWHENYWLSQGHEVRHNMYFQPDLMSWADVVINFWCEGSAGELASFPKEGTHAKRYIQIVDIDAWFGHYRGIDWTNIDGVIFMSKHIQKMCAPFFQEKYPNLPQYHLPLGIDPTEWTFKDRTNHGYEVGFIADEWWSAKNPAMVVQLMSKLVRDYSIYPWHFTWSGAFGPEGWLKAYILNQIEELGLRDKVTINWNREPDIHAFYDKLDYFVTFSQKDSYSLIVGEAMASGVKSYAHNFWGAKDIWGKYVWSTIDEVAERMAMEPYSSREHRDYIEQNHSMPKILQKWDLLLK